MAASVGAVLRTFVASRSRRRAALLLVWLSCMGCRSGETNVLHVYAASSLTDALGDMEQRFEREHPDVDVQLTFAGSQVLRLQIEQGAPADVFASANDDHVESLVRAGEAGASSPLARSDLVVITPLESENPIASFDQLPTASRIVVGSPSVPVGAYTEQMFERARGRFGDPFVREVRRRVASRESNVRLVRAKVEMGEADAAVVYRTDARSSRRVRVVEVPSDVQVAVTYHVVVLERSPVPHVARAWVEWVRGATGRAVLKHHGFLEAP